MSPTPQQPEPTVVSAASAEVGALPEKAPTQRNMPDFVDLPRGKELSDSNANALAMSRPVQWVVVAGPVGSGKTTLLLSLYEMFQWGKVETFLFAGSETLPAFEEHCHLSRMESENIEPDTVRTTYSPNPTYLHLRIRSDTTPPNFTDFLFTDVSGEMFEHARDSSSACKELTFLRRASHFVLLLDCQKALDLDERWRMVEDAKMLLRSCLDDKMLSIDCVVNVVWSKYDYMIEEEKAGRHQQFRNDVAAQFQADFGDRVTHLVFSEIAARPTKAPSLKFGNGVAQLLQRWVTYCPRKREMKLLPEISGSRESELFAQRHFKQ